MICEDVSLHISWIHCDSLPDTYFGFIFRNFTDIFGWNSIWHSIGIHFGSILRFLCGIPCGCLSWGRFQSIGYSFCYKSGILFACILAFFWHSSRHIVVIYVTHILAYILAVDLAFELAVYCCSMWDCFWHSIWISICYYDGCFRHKSQQPLQLKAYHIALHDFYQNTNYNYYNHNSTTISISILQCIASQALLQRRVELKYDFNKN